jgi:hypothetical protein
MAACRMQGIACGRRLPQCTLSFTLFIGSQNLFLWGLYSTFTFLIGLPILLHKIGGPIVGIYNSLTDT